jgi:hypothetical protein
MEGGYGIYIESYLYAPILGEESSPGEKGKLRGTYAPIICISFPFSSPLLF